MARLIDLLARHTKARNIDVLTYSAGGTVGSDGLALVGREALRKGAVDPRLGEVYPWVSSDVLVALLFHLPPGERGLVAGKTELAPGKVAEYWSFPADYPERLPWVMAGLRERGRGGGGGRAGGGRGEVAGAEGRGGRAVAGRAGSGSAAGLVALRATGGVMRVRLCWLHDGC
ncbi:hypothetical protein GCM10011529_05350 [Polymorphobacter glacialis]|uniref:Uncharacterized protein n=1 Tax=Sandarakinorhabdus glacialis TaxID=1614636 RepID=A0A916ZLF2_9SPHN|nr:hypothetical protein [Polymorphobacter glacialis]GGE01887.1 hypothetical protein GCM10011529_05350 [Polymorphobacter glacialis]